MYIGMECWVDIVLDKCYYDFLLGVVDENKWDLVKVEYYVDDQVIGQLYFVLYNKFQLFYMFEKILKCIIYILENFSQ